MSSSKIEKRLLWHPRNKNRFIVGGGTQITLFGWEPRTKDIQKIAAQSDLQLMKCFAWSTDPSYEDLVAVGLNSGKVELWRLEASNHAKNTISVGPQMSLAMQSTRNALAVSFSTEKPNLLAVGYERNRNDSCLMIYDVAVADSPPSQKSRSSRSSKGNRALLQAFPVPETVSSLAYISDSLLVAGVQNQWLRMYDLRISSVHVAQAPTTKLSGIVTDPFDSNHIACYGDTSVSIWDARMISNALLTFSCKDASADGDRQSGPFTKIEYSTVRRGVLATLTQDSQHVRFWETEQTPSSENTSGGNESTNKNAAQESSRTIKPSRYSWPSPSTILPWSSSSEQNRSSSSVNAYTDKMKHIVLSNTFQTDTFDYPIVSFALAPSSICHPLTSDMIILGKDGELDPCIINDVMKYTTWSARGETFVGAGPHFRIAPGFRDTSTPPEPWEIEAAVQTRDVAVDTRDEKSRSKSRVESIDRYNIRKGSKRVSSPEARGSSLSITRASSRAYSPASIRRYSGESPNRDFSSRVSEVNTQSSDATRRKRSRSRANRSVSRGRKRLGEGSQLTELEMDISMLMRERVIQGYGLSNLYLNSRVVVDALIEDEVLSGVWSWCIYTKTLVSSKLHGIDFSYQGILGIWEGLEPSAPQEFVSLLDGLDLASPSEASSVTLGEVGPSVDVAASLRPRLSYKQSQRMGDGFHGAYAAALNVLNTRGNSEKSMWKLTVSTHKAHQRRLALDMCNWRVGEEDYLRWEKEGKHTQVACWMLLSNQDGKAMSLLMKSKNESHQMLSGAIALLKQSKREIVNYYQNLAVKLQDPYQRIMLSYLIFNDWLSKLEKEDIPLRERLAIALRFANDEELTSFLRSVVKDCIERGDIEGLIVTGLTPRGLDLLQSYVDVTGDVQTAALMSSYVCPVRHKDGRADRWVEAYRDLLDGWKLFHHRCQFDIDRGKILKEGIWNGDLPQMELVKKQFLIKCNYCSKVVDTQQYQRPHEPISMQRKHAAACPNCGRALPRCSVCLMNICIVPDSIRDNNLLHSSFRDTIDDALVFCQTCRHGGHASHIIAWFFDEDGDRRHRTCPVADCECKCDEEDGN